jgi:hypothetical protein
MSYPESAQSGSRLSDARDLKSKTRTGKLMGKSLSVNHDKTLIVLQVSWSNIHKYLLYICTTFICRVIE